MQIPSKIVDISMPLDNESVCDPEIMRPKIEYVSQQVTVLGSVESPGVYPLKGKTTLMQALAMAGGAPTVADSPTPLAPSG